MNHWVGGAVGVVRDADGGVPKWDELLKCKCDIDAIRHHSISIPIYASELAGKTRYTVAFYRGGKRQRRLFTILAEAKREAKAIAEKILRGMQVKCDQVTTPPYLCRICDL